MKPELLDAFLDELVKISSATGRSPMSKWSPNLVSAPRTRIKPVTPPKPPAAPGSLSPKLPKTTQYGKRQNYSRPSTVTPVGTNPVQNAGQRMAPPPNVVFGVR